MSDHGFTRDGTVRGRDEPGVRSASKSPNGSMSARRQCRSRLEARNRIRRQEGASRLRWGSESAPVGSARRRRSPSSQPSGNGWYPCRVPDSQSGCFPARRHTSESPSATSTGVRFPSPAARPPPRAGSCRIMMSALPWLQNGGWYSATRSSYANEPAVWARAIAAAARPLLVTNTRTSVSAVHGLVPPTSR